MKKITVLGLAAGLGAALSAHDATAQSFGNAVAVGDGEVLVGEPVYEMRTGVVYAFRRSSDGAWIRAQRLEPSDGSRGDRFGIRLALGGDELFVSATRADEGAGAVYTFRRSGQRWTESGRLVTDDRSPADSLGSGLAVDGDWLMVGTIAQGSARGAVYAFRRDGDGWRQHSKLVPAGLAEGDRFGVHVAMDDDWAMVSAVAAEEGAGVVYVYRYDAQADAWTEQGRLAAQGLAPETAFGTDVELEDGTALVGAPGFFGELGAVLNYTLGEEGWELTSLLSPFDAEQGAQFGSSVTLQGEAAWIGAPGAANRTGRVYAFTRDATTGEWTTARKIGPPDMSERDAFAATVAMVGDLAVAASLSADYGAGAAYVFERTGEDWQGHGPIEGEVLGMDPVTGGDVECGDNGQAAAFSCESVDLLSFLPLHEMGAGRGVRTNDIWGWTEPGTGREIALVGMTDQMVFVDVTEANRPTYLGRLPKPEEARGSSWRDMKVYDDHVFVVSDGAGEHGMQVFDLSHLRGLDGSNPQTFAPDAHYRGIASAHNIVINTETGFAYSVGSSGGGETCGGGLHMIDVRDPKDPTFAGCFADTSTGRRRTGYTHDAQCLVYRGPDTEHAGREICLGSNETALSIADVTDKENPRALAMSSYPNVGYSHQGWISEDHRYFFMDDELDELGGNVPSTRTLVWDIADLDDPLLVKEHFSENRATDHNLYVIGSTMYQSNYQSGLRVLDVSDPENPVHVGHLDTVPYGEDEPGFGGSWSNYPFFESGNVIVTSGREGLFVVRYRPRTIS